MDNETFNILLTVPNELNEKLCAEAEKEKRSRQAHIVFLLEKNFETSDGNATQSARKPHLMMPKGEKVKITGNGKKEDK